VAESLEQSIWPLLEAVAFAARAHRGQLRKDGQTPYASHVFRVCLVLRHVFFIEDHQALIAAVLHDTVEDTTTDFDDVKEEFGAEIAGWVAALSKDKRQEEHPREAAYLQTLTAAPWQVKVCKLADIFDNLMDSRHTSARQRAKTFKRSREYLHGLSVGLPEQARKPWEIVSSLLEELEAAEPSRAAAP
jgi:guanosine-3',5'-bis(diphosphate) 3'-pyrophosphohydrolase